MKTFIVFKQLYQHGAKFIVVLPGSADERYFTNNRSNHCNWERAGTITAKNKSQARDLINNAILRAIG